MERRNRGCAGKACLSSNTNKTERRTSLKDNNSSTQMPYFEHCATCVSNHCLDVYWEVRRYHQKSILPDSEPMGNWQLQLNRQTCTKVQICISIARTEVLNTNSGHPICRPRQGGFRNDRPPQQPCFPTAATQIHTSTKQQCNLIKHV